MTEEIGQKLATIRATLATSSLGAVRLRGVDWFAWATGGASNVVNLTTEAGVAEVLVTARDAWILTDAIEAPRMRAEEAPAPFRVQEHPWDTPVARERFVAIEAGGEVGSDRPRGGERPLPHALVEARLRLVPAEIARYRALGREAAEAVTDVLSAAQPDWSEVALAGAAAEALWRRGIHPTVLLAAGAERLPRYRHPIPTGAALGRVAMLVVCGRRHGLYANLTRFVAFGGLRPEEQRAYADVAAVEALALDASRPGARLDEIFATIERAYAAAGRPGEERLHHQGGPTGYLAREILATHDTLHALGAGMAVAWNPSVPGMKIEDTLLIGADDVEFLTEDPRWPTRTVGGRRRPGVLER